MELLLIILVIIGSLIEFALWVVGNFFYGLFCLFVVVIGILGELGSAFACGVGWLIGRVADLAVFSVTNRIMQGLWGVVLLGVICGLAYLFK